ncbi:hypothetical protein NDU88_000509 [Pleurodeles waltl]|uniref:Uncharacterized protein n=1 Tax=Pleurodeles waltl TaxID=8319 RepID=A0AAV7N9Q8_PLEWA|nr:hypothetical protein NDU88_000509 [Pleurodeles waltl]
MVTGLPEMGPPRPHRGSKSEAAGQQLTLGQDSPATKVFLGPSANGSTGARRAPRWRCRSAQARHQDGAEAARQQRTWRRRVEFEEATQLESGGGPARTEAAGSGAAGPGAWAGARAAAGPGFGPRPPLTYPWGHAAP